LLTVLTRVKNEHIAPGDSVRIDDCSIKTQTRRVTQDTTRIRGRTTYIERQYEGY